MITLDVEQGSAEWVAARLGIPTASAFHKLVTPKGAASKQSQGYLNQLVAETLLSASLDDYVSDYMERGHLLEEQARRYYELQTDLEATTVGLCMLDDRTAACSPDALVGDDGGLEIKCPSAAVHVGYMLYAQGFGAGEKYVPQVQGAMLVTGRKWWDWLSFHPELPPVLLRYQRDEDYIGRLERVLETFIIRLKDARSFINERYLGEGARGSCPHGNPPADCGACDRASDFAYDAAREDGRL